MRRTKQIHNIYISAEPGELWRHNERECPSSIVFERICLGTSGKTKGVAKLVIKKNVKKAFSHFAILSIEWFLMFIIFLIH